MTNTAAKGEFGVFILKNAKWVLHCTFTNKSQALTELDYLVNMLGVEAKLFIKN